MIQKTYEQICEQMAAIKEGLLKDAAEEDVREYYQICGVVPDLDAEFRAVYDTCRIVMVKDVYDLRPAPVDLDGFLAVRTQISPGCSLNEAITVMEKMLASMKEEYAAERAVRNDSGNKEGDVPMTMVPRTTVDNYRNLIDSELIHRVHHAMNVYHGVFGDSQMTADECARLVFIIICGCGASHNICESPEMYAAENIRGIIACADDESISSEMILADIARTLRDYYDEAPMLPDPSEWADGRAEAQ